MAQESCSTEASVSKSLVLADLSGGREEHPIPVYNSIDDTVPSDYYYATRCVKAPEVVEHEALQKFDKRGCECSGGVCGKNCLCAKQSTIKFNPKKRIIDDPCKYNFYKDFYVECGPHCKCAGKCGRRILPRDVLLKKCELHFMGARGFGVVAAQPIARGMPVVEYTGDVFSLVISDELFPISHYQLDVLITEDEHYCVDARRIGNVSRFFNHSCHSNLIQIRVYPSIPCPKKISPIPKCVLVAFRDVLPGDELTFDYGVEYFKARNLRCLCYQPKCIRKPKDYKSKCKKTTAAKVKKEEEQTRKKMRKLMPLTKDLEPPCIDLE